ncbi:copper resistance CopC family protein [Micromonospora sp. KC606]|uniref:copper resistance CopC family protein n=1 Tax=Micromonospora sp. KC606 TaxID=2530379 RepID=UPI001FB7A580|nr:copper resistance CopC family protein [Micromonospora sp. KC606]
MARATPVVMGAALGVSLLLPAVPAAAHNSLTGSSPADGARVAAAPTQVELRFLSKLDPATTTVTVVGPGRVPAAGGEPRFAGNRVRVPFAPGPAGEYTVGYQVASGDGHPVKGQVTFTLTTGAPAPAPSPTPSPTGPVAQSATPGGGTPAGDAPTSAEPASAAADDRTAPIWPWLLGAGLAVALGGALLLLLRRRRS